MSNNRYAQLSITFNGDYLNGKVDPVTGKPVVVFRYLVDGKQPALDIYKDVQGGFLRECETTGKALWFTTRYCGEQATLLVNPDTGKCFPDMSEFRKLASLAEQFGPQVAQSAISKLFSKKAEAPAAPKQA